MLQIRVVHIKIYPLKISCFLVGNWNRHKFRLELHARYELHERKSELLTCGWCRIGITKFSRNFSVHADMKLRTDGETDMVCSIRKSSTLQAGRARETEWNQPTGSWSRSESPEHNASAPRAWKVISIILWQEYGPILMLFELNNRCQFGQYSQHELHLWVQWTKQKRKRPQCSRQCVSLWSGTVLTWCGRHSGSAVHDETELNSWNTATL
jgi:hypothetical protein